MQRYPRAVLEKRPDLRRKDLETTKAACERFRDTPVSVLNFLEGTRFSPAKRDLQRSPYRHLLLPRAGGIAQVVSIDGRPAPDACSTSPSCTRAEPRRSGT